MWACANIIYSPNTLFYLFVSCYMSPHINQEIVLSNTKCICQQYLEINVRFFTSNTSKSQQWGWYHTFFLAQYINASYQWSFQDPIHGGTYHIRPYFVGIFPYIGLKNRPFFYGRYLQSIVSCCMAIDTSTIDGVPMGHKMCSWFTHW